MSTSSLQIKSYDNYHDFLSLKEDWQDLFRRSNADNVFLSWEWMELWGAQFARNKKLKVLAVYAGEKVVAIFPFMLRAHKFRKPSVVFMADPLFADYMGFLIDYDYAAVLSLLQQYLDGYNYSLLNLRDIDKYFDLFRKVITNNYISEVRVRCVSPFINVEGSFADYYSQRSKRLRQDIRTTLNKLNAQGEWRYQRVSTDADVKQELSVLMDLHLERQQNKPFKSIFLAQKHRDFFNRLAVSKNNSFENHLSIIKWNNKVVSCVYSLICGDTFYYWIPVIDSSFGNVSLGKLHIKCLLEEVFHEPKIKKFDFMGGDEAYKYQWADGQFSNYQVVTYNSRLEKLIGEYLLWMKKVCKNLKNNSKFLKLIWRKLSKLREM
ncbi:MAG: GNAT family N-acetyltransferase [Gammaproteobacteria bacterium]|jgi:CelD/BcsL family acetyltransferase involved in cellulose biosynthesis